MPSAESINQSLLNNNAGILSQGVPNPFESLISAITEVEPVEVGPAYTRRLRKETRRSVNQGRYATRRYGNTLRQEIGNDLNYAQGVQGQLTGIVNAIPGMSQAWENLGLAGDSLAGSDQLYGRLRGMANDELDAGSQLTAGEQREAEQAARNAFSARGLANSDPAAVAEVLNRHNFGYSRLRDRQQFAQGLIGQGQSLASSYSGLGAQNASMAQMYDPLSRLGLGTGRGAQAFMPAMQMAQSVQNQYAASENARTGQQASIDSQAALADASHQFGLDQQMNQFTWDDYMTQLNHAYGAQIGQLNANAGMAAGAMGMAGQLGGAVLGNLPQIGSALGVGGAAAGAAGAGGGGIIGGIGGAIGAIF